MMRILFIILYSRCSQQIPCATGKKETYEVLSHTEKSVYSLIMTRSRLRALAQKAREQKDGKRGRLFSASP